MNPPIRVLIVNDSKTGRAALRAALQAEPGITVVGELDNGADATSAVSRLRPSIVLMDVVMPGVDGYAATREIMNTVPTPIVLVSSVVRPRDLNVAMDALRSGALSVIEGLPGPTDPSYPSRRAALVQLVRSMARVKVRALERPVGMPPPANRPDLDWARQDAVSAIGIAASTGGPNAIVELLTALPRGQCPTLLIVQHMTHGFSAGLASWLGQATGHPVALGEDGAPLEPGRVYVAPDDRHLGVDGAGHVIVRADPPVGLFRPSGTYLFRSLAQSLGSRAIGVILSGMGDDAADGAVALRRAGGNVVAQDEATSIVYGMPRAAQLRGGVDVVLPLGEIAAWICGRSGISCARS